CFIRGYSTVASLLTALLCGKRKRLCWSDSAQATFKHLKHCFTLAPILHHLDPTDLSDVPSVDNWFEHSQAVWESAHVRLQRAIRHQCLQPDQRRRPHPPYQPGQFVWLSTWNLKLKLPSRMLSPKFIKLFKILRQINPVTYRLQLPPGYWISPSFHAS
ncbi:hypothetical protein QTP86_029390, partial [Hemibagrus guttatus]